MIRRMVRSIRNLKLVLALVLLVVIGSVAPGNDREASRQRLLYVASPGIHDFLEWGGHGVLVFDINDRHRFVKRISLDGYGIDKTGKVLNLKGICANANTGRLYISTLRQLVSIDLLTDKVLWEKSF